MKNKDIINAINSGAAIIKKQSYKSRYGKIIGSSYKYYLNGELIKEDQFWKVNHLLKNNGRFRIKRGILHNMSVKNFTVSICSRSEIKDFIEHWHYSKNVNGLTIDYCFKLMDGDILIGAMIYGKIAMANVWKKYAENENDLIELKRLCCIDDTPKNTESYFIGKTLKYLKKAKAAKTVISYADMTYGHEGVIYKASNFKHSGITATGRVIMYNGKRYHDKTIRTKYKGELKPFDKTISSAIISGDAEYVNTLGKHIYLYEL